MSVTELESAPVYAERGVGSNLSFSNFHCISRGDFTITSPKVFAFQCRVQNPQLSYGLGLGLQPWNSAAQWREIIMTARS